MTCKSNCKVVMAEPRQAQFGMRLPIENEACRVWPATRLQGPDLVASTEADRFQIIVGLDDLPQPILRGAVATIGVGMMPLHKRLEPRFDVLRGGVRLEPERVERFAFGILSRCAGTRALEYLLRRTPGKSRMDHRR